MATHNPYPEPPGHQPMPGEAGQPARADAQGPVAATPTPPHAATAMPPGAPPPTGAPVAQPTGAPVAPPTGGPVAPPAGAPVEPHVPGEPHIVVTDPSAKDGLAKCPRCGATEIGLNVASGLLRCAFCRHEWTGQGGADDLFINQDITTLTGMVIGSGSQNIVASTEDVLTFKCSACGAEVVINTAESTQARCHWCRNKLSMNQQIANGAVPDVVLPFSLKKEDAVEKIRAFVKKRRTFAHPQFLKEFAPENVMGVYLPYLVVDINAHARFDGEGEPRTRTFTVGNDKNKRTVYDADVYRVRRELAIYINDLTVDTSSERRDHKAAANHNNTNNTVMTRA